MGVIDGYQPWQIDYSNVSASSFSTANGSCTSSKCKLYAPDGGGVPDSFLAKKHRADASVCATAPTYAGQHDFRNMSIKSVGIDNQRDLVLVILGVTLELCKEVNNVFGIPNPSGAPPVDATTGTVRYSGTLTQEVSLTQSPVLGETANGISGKQMFCAETAAASGCYHVYYTLIER